MTSATRVFPSERVISRRERWIVLSAGVGVTLVAWYLLGATGPQSAGWSAAILHAHHQGGTGRTVLAAVAMWQTMMVAMMAPIVLRWILVFGALLAEAIPGRRVLPTLAAFAAGYFAIWSVYSVACGTLQAFLHQAALIDLQDGMRATAAGVVLAGAGLFQQSAFKRACLAHCRSPLGYFLTRWRNGPMGGFRLGMGHGLYCAGCCWAMMVAALAVGVMNLLWMALLTIVMCVEQIAPRGDRIGRGLGWAMTVWGIALIVRG